MSNKWIMFVALLFILGTLLCNVMEGTWFGAHGEISVLNELTGARLDEAGGFWAVVSLPVGFFLGFFRMILWDYSFLTGGLVILRVILSVITLATLYQLFATFIPSLPSIIPRR